jgi:hypothetical protein
MKTKLYYLFILGFALAFAAPKADAQTLIQFWDFNQTRPLGGAAGDSLGTVTSYASTIAMDTTSLSTWPLNADYSAPSLTMGKIVYTRPTTHYSSFARDSTLENGSPGAFYYDYSSSNYTYFTTSDSGSGNVFIRARNPSDSCEFYMYIPTTGYQGISLDFAISQSSTKGAQYCIMSYSTNLGSSWKNLTTAMDTLKNCRCSTGLATPDTLCMDNGITSTSGWYPVHIDFSSDLSVNNNANFIFRFMMAGTNSVLSSGNDRFDNFAVLAQGPASVDNIAGLNAGYTIYPNPAQNIVNVVSNKYTDAKTITVYNVVGQIVSVTENKNKQTAIDISALSSGVYFIEIKELATGNSYTEKVVKE